MDSNPEQRYNDIVTGKVSVDRIVMAEWFQLVLMRMVAGQDSEIDISLPYGGCVFHMHHYVERINPPMYLEEPPLMGEKTL